MLKLHRNLVAPLASFALCLTIAGVLRAADEPATENPSKAQLEQVAQTIATVAKDSIASAKNDSEAVKRAQASFDILQKIGELGGFDTSAESDKLMDDLRASAKPAVIESLVQMQFMNKMRRWSQMSEDEREAAIGSFVTDVKKCGLTPMMAQILAQYASSYGERDKKGLLLNAIKEVLPAAKGDDAKAKHAFEMLEGVARLLDLPGKPLELEGKLLTGEKLDWASYRGKVVLVDFYASWCGPCRAEAPNVLKNYKAYHDKGFDVVTVNLDTDPKLAEKYIKETGCDFPTIYSEDPKGWETPMATKYGINAIPRVVLVGKDGNVVSTNARGEVLGQLLGKLLGPNEGADEKKSDDAAPAADEKKDSK